MDINDSEESNGSSHFIVIDSQVETQEWDQSRILHNLPALRQDSPRSPVIELTHADTVKPKVFLPATDSEAEVPIHSSSEADEVIMETQSDHKSSSSSIEDAEVTVMEMTDAANPDREDQTRSTNGSKEFQLFQPSMSENDTCLDNSDEERLVSTPGKYIGSLHFSGEPLLVPESVEESLNELSASPGVYPVIIPSSPTQVREEDSVESNEITVIKRPHDYQSGTEERQRQSLSDIETQIQDSLHLALSDTNTGMMEKESQVPSTQNVSQDLALHLSPSQGDSMCQGNSQKTRQKLTGTKSSSQPDMSEKLCRSRSKSSSLSTDSGGFHLSLPKQGTLLHPVQPLATEEKQVDSRDDVSRPVVTPSLVLDMIDTSQSTADASFRLQKPELILTETNEESEANIFKKTKAGFDKPHQLVLRESSEDFLGFQSEKTSDRQRLEKSVYDDSTELYEADFGNQGAEKNQDPTSAFGERNKNQETHQTQTERSSIHISSSQSTHQAPMERSMQISPTQLTHKAQTERSSIQILPSQSTHQAPMERSMQILPTQSIHAQQSESMQVERPTASVSMAHDNPARSKTSKLVIDKHGVWSASRDTVPPERSVLATQDRRDPYTFHGSQSQQMENGQTDSIKKSAKVKLQSYPQTPVSTKKRTLLHRKPGIKRLQNVSAAISSTEVEDNTKVEPPSKKRKEPLKKFTKLSERQTPSKCQATEACESPTAGATVATKSKARLLMSPTSTTEDKQPKTHKRRSVEFAEIVQSEVQTSIEDRLSGSLDSDELIEKTTIEETTCVHRLIKVVIMSAKDGRVIRTTEREEEDPPVFLRKVEETKRLNPFISPSRTNSSLTSGDLGDVSSSSLSRHNSSGSKGGSLEKMGSSLDIASLSKSQHETVSRQEENVHASQMGNTPEDRMNESNGTPDVSVIEKTDSRHGAVVSSAESKKTDSLFTSPEEQKRSVAAGVMSNSLAGKSPARQEKADSSEESLGIPPAQVSRSYPHQSKPSESSSGSILSQERRDQARSSQESGGFSVRGSGFHATRSPQIGTLSAFRKSGSARSQPEKSKNSLDDSRRLSPEIPDQTDQITAETSTMRTPAKIHYASKLEKGIQYLLV
ncbi:uncharacterized protein LOC121387793 [Gigantopelta aegis]|uniref:uncharacterized protein LOC121387793 n=1 Tax=Gigantopelta aegis TaxID=1735272 RepID=UPI001B88B55A|nr:uncharacterized protein LOC121387793 [Gigantopelta aegis]